ncbi:MAG: right-handed parallel beta-helix repeat-containing protein [Defluviitaleaceae bacterium]|nr:right-handed parallel beta-helix repeat-containing protein [Defluviitaleaceae bacterium]
MDTDVVKFYDSPQGVRCFYVDSQRGADDNDGLSPGTAWRTTMRVNCGPCGEYSEFLPGDHVLFRRGCTFVGSLVPMGSGVKGRPIVVASYGDSPKRPVLTPAPEDSMGLNADYVLYKYWYVSTTNTPYWGVDQIRIFNQQYYEIRDLELYDPNYGANMPQRPDDSGNDLNSQRYRRGILISAEDAGHLHGFLVDNMVISGYRGTNSNRGKSAGGIIFKINTSDIVENRKETTLNDITITNCYMHHLGRSGINFTTPWCGRTANGPITEGDDWGNYDYESTHDTVSGRGGKQQFGWLPNKNVHIAGNVIHEIDGDGIIIDNCKNVVVERNLVYHAHLRCQMAVGIFPWNSDNVIIQYNEVHSTWPAHATGPHYDSQGIEIDALNRDVYVQYNYTHNNGGGLLMFCNTTELRGFRYYYRYNISQYDGDVYGRLFWMGNTFDGGFYNNTVITKDTQGVYFSNGNPAIPNRGINFFNNLFLHEGGKIQLSNFPTPDIMRAYTDINWQNNCFFNFPKNLTVSALGGEAKNNVITCDNVIIQPGTGPMGNTTAPVESWNSQYYSNLKAYSPISNSLLIKAGATIVAPTQNPNVTFISHGERQVSSCGFDFNSGKDFFGTPVRDCVDIGAVQGVPLPI